MKQGVAMLLDHQTGRPPTLSSRPLLVTSLVFASFMAACMPAQDAEPGPSGSGGKTNASGGKGGGNASGGSSSSGGSTGSGGSSSGGGSTGSGGSSSSGGSTGSGGSSSGGGSTGSGGSSSSGGSTGSGGKSGDAGTDTKTDAKPDPNAPLPPDGTWANLKNAMSGCVFCHPGETGAAKNTDFGDMAKLRALLLAESKYIGATCPIKILVVPGKPLESLLYIKVAGKPPAGCGDQMPKGKTPDQWNTDVIKNWIMAGAPGM
jgi:hypothetical protein